MRIYVALIEDICKKILRDSTCDQNVGDRVDSAAFPVLKCMSMAMPQKL